MKLALFLGLAAIAAAARADLTPQELDAAAAALEPRVSEWRRDFHRHPELANREFRTSKTVAEHLKRLGLEVRTGIAHTGVVGVLKGALPGPTVLLRADMDALPVTEHTDLPFRSTATGEFRGRTVGVMHACGHDAHTAILMGAAQVLTGLRGRLRGTVLFVFQPAEEGVPEGERGGAPLMLDEGLLDIAKPDAAFALHVLAKIPTGIVGLRPGPLMAGSDFFRITVTGRQSHGAQPWSGIDPIVTSAQIINSIQTVVSRQTNLSAFPAVVTVGAINGGVRHNIIPESVEMLGTMRTFTPEMRQQTIDGVRRIVEHIAAANGATGTIEMMPAPNPPTVNDAALSERALGSLRAAFGDESVQETPLQTIAEDFAHIARAVPSVYFWVGVTPQGQDAATAADNHSDRFYLDEAGMMIGLRAMLHVTVDYLQGAEARPDPPSR